VRVTTARFEAGQTIVRRDVFHGRIWSAHALRTGSDTEAALVAAACPGAETQVSATFSESLRTGNDTLRKQAVPNLAAGTWQLDRRLWTDTVCLYWSPPESWYTVNLFYCPDDDHRFRNWYINFERPARRTARGYDTFDLLVDLVIEPDLDTWHWKDEDEYAQARRLGVVDDTDHKAVDGAREEVIGLIETRQGPFAPDSGLPAWRYEADWPVPELPDNALRLDSSAG
jgi:protein associated with RNAse G/E